MAYYKTQIAKIGAGYAVDVAGKRLKFIGNYPCQAGDFVWTDGNVIFGNITNDSQPVMFSDTSGIPVLGLDLYNRPLRGYFDSSGNFKNYKVSPNLTDDQLAFSRWFVNNNNKTFYGDFPRYGYSPNDIVVKDIEVTDDNNVFIANTYSEFDWDSANSKIFFKISGAKDNLSNYTLIKNVDDFKGDSDWVDLLFLKLQRGTSAPVKWFAVFKSERHSSGNISAPNTKNYEIIQHTEKKQDMSFVQPGIWNCTVEIEEKDVPNDDYKIRRYIDHYEIFSVDSDDNKKIIYSADITDEQLGGYPSVKAFYLPNYKIEKVAVNYERYGMGPYPHPNNFEGTITIEWTQEVIQQSLDHYSGNEYKVVRDDLLVELKQNSISENLSSFTYPVSNGFYISADDINSTLKLYDANDNLVLDFATSDDEFLAGLTGFHNFAAIVVKKDEYLLTIKNGTLKNITTNLLNCGT
jgi:hypothetical protein